MGISRNARDALISFAGPLELNRSPGLVRATGDEPMSDDPDFPTANHALQVLRQARLSRNEAAAIMLGDLVYEMAGTGLRTPEIEEAHQAAWVAISALAKTLQADEFAPPALWKAAFGATESLDRTTRLAVFAAAFLAVVNDRQRGRARRRGWWHQQFGREP